jgi:hypothetical protein
MGLAAQSQSPQTAKLSISRQFTLANIIQKWQQVFARKRALTRALTSLQCLLQHLVFERWRRATARANESPRRSQQVSPMSAKFTILTIATGLVSSWLRIFRSAPAAQLYPIDTDMELEEDVYPSSIANEGSRQ